LAIRGTAAPFWLPKIEGIITPFWQPLDVPFW
jgi:hypothetical protein